MTSKEREELRSSGVVMCRILEVSRSGFHAWQRRRPSDRQLADAWLLEQIKVIHEENRRVYGAPRIHAELRMSHGIGVGLKRVERLDAPGRPVRLERVAA